MNADKERLLTRVRALSAAHKAGLLGGARMPEHENPGLRISSRENYMYFTLPMALNYQRDSYKLWSCANAMYADENGRSAFDSAQVCAMSEDELREILVSFRVALQPNRHTDTWRRLCATTETLFGGDIRRLFDACGNSAAEVKRFIAARKRAFPCLGGPKICNYWLHVIEQYTDMRFIDRGSITVAPDTHVIQSSVRLGIISSEEALRGDVQQLTAASWESLLAGTGIAPIDMHTPLWLWSRGGFSYELPDD